MVQTGALSLQALDATEDLADLVQMAAADGVICEREIAILLPKMGTAVDLVREADLARAAGAAVSRGGVGAKRAHDLLLQIDDLAMVAG